MVKCCLVVDVFQENQIIRQGIETLGRLFPPTETARVLIDLDCRLAHFVNTLPTALNELLTPEICI